MKDHIKSWDVIQDTILRKGTSNPFQMLIAYYGSSSSLRGPTAKGGSDVARTTEQVSDDIAPYDEVAWQSIIAYTSPGFPFLLPLSGKNFTQNVRSKLEQRGISVTLDSSGNMILTPNQGARYNDLTIDMIYQWADYQELFLISGHVIAPEHMIASWLLPTLPKPQFTRKRGTRMWIPADGSRYGAKGLMEVLPPSPPANGDPALDKRFSLLRLPKHPLKDMLKTTDFSKALPRFPAVRSFLASLAAWESSWIKNNVNHLGFAGYWQMSPSLQLAYVGDYFANHNWSDRLQLKAIIKLLQEQDSLIHARLNIAPDGTVSNKPSTPKWLRWDDSVLRDINYHAGLIAHAPWVTELYLHALVHGLGYPLSSNAITWRRHLNEQQGWARFSQIVRATMDSYKHGLMQ